MQIRSEMQKHVKYSYIYLIWGALKTITLSIFQQTLKNTNVNLDYGIILMKSLEA